MIAQVTGALTNQAHHQFLVSVDGSDYSHRAFEACMDLAKGKDTVNCMHIWSSTKKIDNFPVSPILNNHA